MGAGRKIQKYTLSVRVQQQHSYIGNASVSARNLRKNDLGGVIFGCKHSTMKECLQSQIFGLPPLHISYVKNIQPGLPLFLFNYSDRKMHGIFEAATHGQLNINPHGWTADGSEKTQYPAQVRIRIRKKCNALSEEKYSPIIGYNYHGDGHHFWFELDHAQTWALLSLFKSSPLIEAILYFPPALRNQHENVNNKQEHSKPSQKQASSNVAPTWASLFNEKPNSEAITGEGALKSSGLETDYAHGSYDIGSSSTVSGFEDDEVTWFQESHWDHAQTGKLLSSSPSMVSDLEEENQVGQLQERHSDSGQTRALASLFSSTVLGWEEENEVTQTQENHLVREDMETDVEQVYLKLKQIKLARESSNTVSEAHIYVPCTTSETYLEHKCSPAESSIPQKCEDVSIKSSDFQSVIGQSSCEKEDQKDLSLERVRLTSALEKELAMFGFNARKQEHSMLVQERTSSVVSPTWAGVCNENQHFGAINGGGQLKSSVPEADCAQGSYTVSGWEEENEVTRTKESHVDHAQTGASLSLSSSTASDWEEEDKVTQTQESNSGHSQIRELLSLSSSTPSDWEEENKVTPTQESDLDHAQTRELFSFSSITVSGWEEENEVTRIQESHSDHAQTGALLSFSSITVSGWEEENEVTRIQESHLDHAQTGTLASSVQSSPVVDAVPYIPLAQRNHQEDNNKKEHSKPASWASLFYENRDSDSKTGDRKLKLSLPEAGCAHGNYNYEGASSVISGWEDESEVTNSKGSYLDHSRTRALPSLIKPSPVVDVGPYVPLAQRNHHRDFKGKQKHSKRVNKIDLSEIAPSGWGEESEVTQIQDCHSNHAQTGAWLSSSEPSPVIDVVQTGALASSVQSSPVVDAVPYIPLAQRNHQEDNNKKEHFKPASWASLFYENRDSDSKTGDRKLKLSLPEAGCSHGHYNYEGASSVMSGWEDESEVTNSEGSYLDHARTRALPSLIKPSPVVDVLPYVPLAQRNHHKDFKGKQKHSKRVKKIDLSEIAPSGWGEESEVTQIQGSHSNHAQTGAWLSSSEPSPVIDVAPYVPPAGINRHLDVNNKQEDSKPPQKRYFTVIAPKWVNLFNENPSSDATGGLELKSSVLEVDCAQGNNNYMEVGYSSMNSGWEEDTGVTQVQGSDQDKEDMESDVDRVYLKLKQIKLGRESLITVPKAHSEEETGVTQAQENHLDKENMESDVERVYLKLKQIKLSRESLSTVPEAHSEEVYIPSTMSEIYFEDRCSPAASLIPVRCEDVFINFSAFQSVINQLRREMKDQKVSSVERFRTIIALDKKLACYHAEIQQLGERVALLESLVKNFSPARHAYW